MTIKKIMTKEKKNYDSLCRLPRKSFIRNLAPYHPIIYARLIPAALSAEIFFSTLSPHYRYR